MSLPVRALHASLVGGTIVLATFSLAPTAARGEMSLPSPQITELDRAPVELISPPREAVLVAGSTAEIAWRPLADFASLAGAEEWEAFLSLDGGRTFAIRLTPHLDLARRRFAFRVPGMPSDSVRLLLRFGDEHAERAVRMPTPLRIVRGPSTGTEAMDPLAERAFAPGESALAGDPGVVFWVEGHRDGSGEHAREAAPERKLSGSPAFLSADGDQALADDEGADPRLAVPDPLKGSSADPDLPPAEPVARAELLTPSDILLLIQRQNE